MAGAPSRIASLVPSITETLFALGLAEKIVGVTRYCERPRQMPPHVRRVGGTKNPEIEAIRALSPDLVFVNTEENRREDIEAIKEFAVVSESFARTAPEGVALVRQLGELTGAHREAREMAESIETELSLLEKQSARAGGQRRRAGYFIWKDPWMSVGRDTFIHDVLVCAGLENVYAGRSERYPETSFEEMARLAPEVILLPHEPYSFTEKHRAELLEREDIPAARMGRIYLVNGQYFCWYGVRQIEALRWIREVLSA